MVYRLFILAAIIAVNGFFAASEVALVSVRRSRLRAMAERGVTGVGGPDSAEGRNWRSCCAFAMKIRCGIIDATPG